MVMNICKWPTLRKLGASLLLPLDYVVLAFAVRHHVSYLSKCASFAIGEVRALVRVSALTQRPWTHIFLFVIIGQHEPQCDSRLGLFCCP